MYKDLDSKAETKIKGDQITSIHELAFMGNIHFSEDAAKSKETALQNPVIAAAMRLASNAAEDRQATSFRQLVNIDSAVEIFFQELLPQQPFTLFLNRVAEMMLMLQMKTTFLVIKMMVVRMIMMMLLMLM
jgi:hypothetical protein